MAGKEFAKHKTLAVYDYFRTQVSVDSKNDVVSIKDILSYLKTIFGDDFERKSIYSDIKTINEYKSQINGNESDWIEKVGKGGYIRTAEKDDFTMDEVHLLLDAVNATPLCDRNMAEKIKKQWPTYFKHDEYISFLECEHQKPTRAFITLMNNLRKAIKEKQAIKIRYGYKLISKDQNNVLDRERKISPLALYFAENKYYLFAIDNDRMKQLLTTMDEESAKKEALRQFRIDRFGGPVNFMGKEKYFACDLEIVKNKFAGSVDAYSSGKTVDVKMTIEGNPELVLRAFNYLQDETTIKGIFSDNWQSGKLSFFLNVSPTPRFFALLMNLSTFSSDKANGVNITLDVSKEFQDAYDAFLKQTKNNINFSTPS